MSVSTKTAGENNKTTLKTIKGDLGKDTQTNNVTYRTAAKSFLFEKLMSGESSLGPMPSSSSRGNYGVGGRGGDNGLDQVNTGNPTEDQLFAPQFKFDFDVTRTKCRKY